MRPKTQYVLRFCTYLSLTLGAFVSLLPLVTVLFASFKTPKEFGFSGALALPQSWMYLGNYITAWTKAKMMLAFWNTSLILIFTLAGSIITGTMIAYILSRFSFKGRNFLKGAFLVANLIPGVTMQVSTYRIMTSLGLVNSIPGIVMLYTGTDIIAIYIFLQFFESIPHSLDEAAYIDGASYFTIFFKILFPLVKPATVTVLILKGVAVYKEYYLANLYLQSKTRYVTVSTSLYTFTGEYGNQYNYICAGVMITIIPVLIAFIFLQRYIYNGIARGAVKE
ncbi:carbohydrate ABC transporter permease [uncultured Sphaerochaeta sp.]|uniref:carbohydrate ABC transporter permease n=1 Tax=uncultured Sphaerochaeta sp. TaxID=886478 RepID=UPI002A0A3AEB|nr:carbohydrate ABC transporter permease [uncultured Sphaerochaeta sp.]